jgi:hypothetical protein
MFPSFTLQSAMKVPASATAMEMAVFREPED